MSVACPRCSRDIEPARHPTGIAWRCRACGGQSLNFSQFRRTISDDGASLIWSEAMARPSAPRRRTLCPECHQDMAAVNLPMKEREVEIDVCRSCQRLWLDRQDSIAGHLAAGDEPGPQLAPKTVDFEARERHLNAVLREIRIKERWRTFYAVLLCSPVIIYFGLGLIRAVIRVIHFGRGL